MPRPNVSEKRTQDILRAAAAVFNERGLQNARMDDVALAAGISKGTIYLYFPSKDHVVETLLRQVFVPMDVAVEVLADPHFSARQRLEQCYTQMLHAFTEYRDLYPLLLELFALARRQPYAMNLFTEYFTAYRTKVTSCIREGASTGEFQPRLAEEEAATIAALGFMSALDGALLIAMINPDLIDLIDHGMGVMARVITGLAR
jgi:AcrR family transcriptional regulator